MTVSTANSKSWDLKSFFNANRNKLIILLCSVIVYSNTIYNDYTLDDQLAIYDNKFVQKGFDGISDILTNDAFVGFFGERGAKLIAGGRYRPISFVTFAIENSLFGQNPHISHLINILLFGFTCILIYKFLIFLLDEKEDFFSISFVATILFVLHPIHTEVVANIKGRDEILAVMFGFLAFKFWFYSKRSKMQRYFLYTFCFFLALLSKENAITFIGVIFLISFFKKINLLDIENRLFLISTVLSSIIFLILRNKFTSSSVAGISQEILNNPFVKCVGTEKVGTIIYSFFLYFKLLIFPKVLTHDYYFNQIPYRKLTDISVILVAISLISIIILYIKRLKARTIDSFGFWFFIITFSIVSNIPFTVGIIMNERFVFLPSIGFSLLFTYILFFINNKYLKNNRILGVILFIICTLYSIKSFTRNFDWKDNTTLFERDFINSPNSAKVSASYGGALGEKADTTVDINMKNALNEKSLEILRKSISIYPENTIALNLYAKSHYNRYQNSDTAINIYRKASQLRTEGFFDAYFNLGVVFFNIKQYDSSMKYISIAYNTDPEHKQTKEIYAKLLSLQGNTDEAIKLVGNNNNSLVDLAMNAKMAGDFAKAIELSDKILATNPNDPTANYVKGISLARGMNNLIAGIPFLEKAVSINQNNGDWLEDLAVAYGFTNQIAKSAQVLERVVAISPDANAYRNLAASYFKLGKKIEAENCIKKAATMK